MFSESICVANQSYSELVLYNDRTKCCVASLTFLDLRGFDYFVLPPSMPLQDLPCMSLQGSMLSQSKGINKRKSRGYLSEGLDTECTPTELIQQWSPRHKHQRIITKGKENDNQFVLARRSRRKKESTSGRKHLSDLLYRCSGFFL